MSRFRQKIGDKFGSGIAKDLIEISVDGISEKGINGIADFIKGEKSKIDSILSEENIRSMGISEDKTNYVVSEIKDLLSRTDITDEVLRHCKYDSTVLKDFLWNKYEECKNDYIECESEIKRCLFAFAEALIKIVRESENFEKKVLIQISNCIDDTNVGLQNILDYIRINFGKLDDNNQFVLKEHIQKDRESCLVPKIKFQNDKKQKYIENWNSRLFLHIDNDKRPITLADAFIVPDYKMYSYFGKIKFDDNDSLVQVIEKFIKHDRTATMLIAGAPGIGKSTITSWIANQYKDNDSINILRFRDWNRIVLEKTLVSAICKKIGCKKEDLENKVLILDGFDEMKALNIRDRLLNDFFMDIKDFDNFKCIITSRPTYIKSYDFSHVVILKEFDLNKITSFYKIITGNELDKKEKIESNLEVLGIPVILYMAIMSDVDITENPTKPELYNRIFAKKGGIFDKFYDGKVEYSRGKQILRDPKNIEKYLDFLRNIAFTMFEKNELYLMEKEYQIPELEFQGEFVNILEFPMKYFFEGTENNIEFIHKSIYEYFVSDYIFLLMYEIICSNALKEEKAGVLGKILKKNRLSPEIIEFLSYKIENSEFNNKFNTIIETFHLMLKDGMTYYTYEHYKSVVNCEINVFVNMLEIIHLFGNKIIEVKSSICQYLKFNRYNSLNLSKIVLSWNSGDVTLEGVYLKGANLVSSDFRNVRLSNSDFRNADLMDSEFVRANLEYSDFRGAILKNIDLRGAELTGALFDEQQVIYLGKKYNLYGMSVYIDKTKEIISYAEYYKRNKCS